MAKGGAVRRLGLLCGVRAPMSFSGEKGVRGVVLFGLLLLAPLPAAAQPAEPSPTVLHLSQTAERRVMRDLLRVELRVEETGSDPLALQAAVNRRMAAALQRARQVQGVEVETGNYEVNEEQPQNAPRRWRASQSLILTGKAADARAETCRNIAIGRIADVVNDLRGLARDGARCRGGFDGRGVGRARAARILSCRPGSPLGAALSRSARRQCRDRRAADAALCGNGDGGAGRPTRRGRYPGHGFG